MPPPGGGGGGGGMPTPPCLPSPSCSLRSACFIAQSVAEVPRVFSSRGCGFAWRLNGCLLLFGPTVPVNWLLHPCPRRTRGISWCFPALPFSYLALDL